jgi:hypothetical protein
MDPKGKIFDERAGIAEPFVFAPAGPGVIAALEELGQFLLELRRRSGRKVLGSGNLTRVPNSFGGPSRSARRRTAVTTSETRSGPQRRGGIDGGSLGVFVKETRQAVNDFAADARPAPFPILSS